MARRPPKPDSSELGLIEADEQLRHVQDRHTPDAVRLGPRGVGRRQQQVQRKRIAEFVSRLFDQGGAVCLRIHRHG
jgi:hypothetical protein